MKFIPETNIKLKERRSIELQMSKSTCAQAVNHPPEVYKIAQDLYLINSEDGQFEIYTIPSSSLVYSLVSGIELGSLDETTPGITVKVVFTEKNIKIGHGIGNIQNRIAAISLLGTGSAIYSEYATDTSGSNSCSDIAGIATDPLFTTLLDIDVGGSVDTHLFVMGVISIGTIVYHSAYPDAYNENAYPDFLTRFTESNFIRVFAFDWGLVALNTVGRLKVALHITKNNDPYYLDIQSSMEAQTDILHVFDIAGCIILQTNSGRILAYAKTSGESTQIVTDLNTWSNIDFLRLTDVGIIGVKKPDDDNVVERVYTSQLSRTDESPHSSFVELQGDLEKWGEDNLWSYLHHNGVGFYALNQIEFFIYTTGMDLLMDFDALQSREYRSAESDGTWSYLLGLHERSTSVRSMYLPPIKQTEYKQLCFIDKYGRFAGVEWSYDSNGVHSYWDNTYLSSSSGFFKMWGEYYEICAIDKYGYGYRLTYENSLEYTFNSMLEWSTIDKWYDSVGHDVGMTGNVKHPILYPYYDSTLWHVPSDPLEWGESPFQSEMEPSEVLLLCIGQFLDPIDNVSLVRFYQTNKGRIFTTSQTPELITAAQQLKYTNADFREWYTKSGHIKFGIGWVPDGGVGNFKAYPDSNIRNWLTVNGLSESNFNALQNEEVIDVSIFEDIWEPSFNTKSYTNKNRAYGFVVVLKTGEVMCFIYSISKDTQLVVADSLSAVSGVPFTRVCAIGAEFFALFTEDQTYDPSYIIPVLDDALGMRAILQHHDAVGYWYTNLDISRKYMPINCTYSSRKSEEVTYVGHDKIILLYDYQENDIGWIVLKDDNYLEYYLPPSGRFSTETAQIVEELTEQYASIFWTNNRLSGAISAAKLDGTFVALFEDGYHNSDFYTNYQNKWTDIIKVRSGMPRYSWGIPQYGKIGALRRDGGVYIGDTLYSSDQGAYEDGKVFRRYSGGGITAGFMINSTFYNKGPTTLYESDGGQQVSLFGLVTCAAYGGDAYQTNVKGFYHIFEQYHSDTSAKIFTYSKDDGIVDVVSTIRYLYTLYENGLLTAVNIWDSSDVFTVANVAAIVGNCYKRTRYTSERKYFPETLTNLCVWIYNDGTIGGYGDPMFTSSPGWLSLMNVTNVNLQFDIPKNDNGSFTQKCVPLIEEGCKPMENCIEYGKLNDDDGSIWGPYHEDCPYDDRDCYRMQMSKYRDRSLEYLMCMKPDV